MRFARHVRVPFEKYIKPRFAGLPIRYLEIGVFEGACLKWMFENVLTNPDSQADAVDPWRGYEAEADRHGNKRIYTQEQMDKCYVGVCDAMIIYSGRCQLHRMSYVQFFDDNEPEPYDMIFLDGEHTYQATLDAATHAITYLVPTGLLIFDDCQIPDVSRAVEAFMPSSGCKEFYRTRQQACLQYHG